MRMAVMRMAKMRMAEMRMPVSSLVPVVNLVPPDHRTPMSMPVMVRVAIPAARTRMPAGRAGEFRAAMAVRPTGHAEATHKGGFLHARIVIESGRAGAHRKSLSGAGKAETCTEKCGGQCVSNVQGRPPSNAQD